MSETMQQMKGKIWRKVVGKILTAKEKARTMLTRAVSDQDGAITMVEIIILILLLIVILCVIFRPQLEELINQLFGNIGEKIEQLTDMGA